MRRDSERSWISGLFLCILALSPSFLLSADDPIGVIVFKNHPDAPALLTYADEFSKIETFGLVVNTVSTSESEERRFMKKNVISIVPYINLKTENIVSENDVNRLEAELESLNKLITEFPTTTTVIRRRIDELSNASNFLDQGMALTNGNWVRKDAIKENVAGMTSNFPIKTAESEIFVQGRRLINPELSGVAAGTAKIRYSDGFASVQVSDLTDDQILALNKTSSDHQLSREGAPKASPENSAMTANASAETGTGLITGSEKTPSMGRWSFAERRGLFRIEVNKLFPELLKKTSQIADENWASLSGNNEEILGSLLAEGEILVSKVQENKELLNAYEILDAFSISNAAAKLWNEGDGSGAIEKFSQIRFPSNFDDTEQYADAWRTLDSLDQDLRERQEHYVNQMEKIKSLESERPLRVSIMEKAIAELLEKFPDPDLEELQKELKKNSLGL